MPKKPTISPVEQFDQIARVLNALDQEYVPIESNNGSIREFREEVNESVLMLRNHLKLERADDIKTVLMTAEKVDDETMVLIHSLEISVEGLVKMVRKHSEECLSELNEGLGGEMDDEGRFSDASDNGHLDVDLHNGEADELDHAGSPDADAHDGTVSYDDMDQFAEVDGDE